MTTFMKSEMEIRMIRVTIPSGKSTYLLDRTAGKADNKCAPSPRNALERVYRTHQYSGVFAPFPPSFWGTRTFDFANRIIDHVDAAPAGDVHHVLLPAVICIVDYNVCAARQASNLKLAWGCCSDNAGAQCFSGLKFKGRKVRSNWMMMCPPLAIWIAAIPTPPAAANTRTHSPIQIQQGRDSFGERMGDSVGLCLWLKIPISTNLAVTVRVPRVLHNSSDMSHRALSNLFIPESSTWRMGTRNIPAPWSNDSVSGSGSSKSDFATTRSANDPCALPNTRSPRLNGLPGGATATVPANSVPRMNGRGGWVW
jgi:hypothetical protein